jgi:hypothetical protein
MSLEFMSREPTMVDDAENFDKELLDDPDERIWQRILDGSETSVSPEEFSYFSWEHKLKALAKQKGWVKNSAATTSSAAKSLTTLPENEGHDD